MAQPNVRPIDSYSPSFSLFTPCVKLFGTVPYLTRVHRPDATVNPQQLEKRKNILADIAIVATSILTVSYCLPTAWTPHLATRILMSNCAVISLAALVVACIVIRSLFESLLTDYFLQTDRLGFATKIAHYIPDEHLRRNQLAQIAWAHLKASEPDKAMQLFLNLIMDTRNEFDPAYGLPPIQTILEQVIASCKQKGYQDGIYFEAALEAIEMMSTIDKHRFLEQLEEDCHTATGSWYDNKTSTAGCLKKDPEDFDQYYQMERKLTYYIYQEETRPDLSPHATARSYRSPAQINFNQRQTALQEALQRCQNPQTDRQRFFLKYYTFLVDYNKYLGSLPKAAWNQTDDCNPSPTMRAFNRRAYVQGWGD